MYHNVYVEVRGQLVGVNSLLLLCGSQGFAKVDRHLYPLHHLTYPDISFINRKQTNN